MKPNLFKFATSELSQDAFLCWLFSWADDKYTDDLSLKSCAKEVLRNFIETSIGTQYLNEVTSIEVFRQWNNVDIVLEINNNIVIAIEDKTYTSEHNDQLQKYKDAVTAHYTEKGFQHFVFVFLKTGNSSLNQKLSDVDYIKINRIDLLTILRKYTTTNEIYNDFQTHLEKLEEETNTYLSKPVGEWDILSYQGFYSALQTQLEPSYNWAYVPNPSGGFMGMWGYFKHTKEGLPLYIQIQYGDLVFKLGEVFKDQASIRDRLHKIILKIAKSNCMDEVKRPGRFGTGKTMTLAVVSQNDFLGNGIVNINDIVKKVKEYEKLIDKCIATDSSAD